MTGIHVHIFLLLCSYIFLVCCEVPQLKIEQNKDVFCLGETARLICQWEHVFVSSWKVNGTLTTTGGLNGMAGHNTSTSLTEGFTRVSITQTQPSVTNYTCIASVNEDFPSEVVYVTFRDSPLKLSILYMRKETYLLVLLNVTSKGCPPLEQVRIAVNNVSLIGRHNDTFRFEGLSPDVEYLLQVETQVEGEDFGLYKDMTVHVYNTADGLDLQEVGNNHNQSPGFHVAVPVAIVLTVLLVAAAVTCGVIIVLRSRHRSRRKFGMHDVILYPCAFQHTANRQTVIPVSSDISNEVHIECPQIRVYKYSSSSESSNPRSINSLLGHYAEIDHNSPHPIAPPPVDNKVVYAKV